MRREDCAHPTIGGRIVGLDRATFGILLAHRDSLCLTVDCHGFFPRLVFGDFEGDTVILQECALQCADDGRVTLDEPNRTRTAVDQACEPHKSLTCRTER